MNLRTSRPVAVILGIAIILMAVFIWLFSRNHIPSLRLSKAAKDTAAPEATANLPPTTSEAKEPKLLDLGRSNKGLAITASLFGTGKRYVVVLGGIHGDELSSTALANALLSYLKSHEVPKDLSIIVVPAVNPDGLHAKTRVNANGVDINRNFPTRSWRPDAPRSRYNPGREPASEPETRALIKLIDQYCPILLISIHAPFGCVNWDGPAEEIARSIAKVNRYPLRQDIGYETPGSLGTYAGIERNIPAVTLELRNAEFIEDEQENLLAIYAAFLSIASQSVSEK